MQRFSACKKKKKIQIWKKKKVQYEKVIYIFEKCLFFFAVILIYPLKKKCCLSQHVPSTLNFPSEATNKVIQKVTHTILNIGLFLDPPKYILWFIVSAQSLFSPFKPIFPCKWLKSYPLFCTISCFPSFLFTKSPFFPQKLTVSSRGGFIHVVYITS